MYDKRGGKVSKILVVEPYFGGSHKQFLEGLKKHISAEFIFLTLPARKWKMRMQLSAPWFAESIGKMTQKDFTTILCSTFVDVAVLKALLLTLPGWNVRCSFCTYFHENQFVYPQRDEEKTRFQFTSINFTTALVSDKIAFNSYYNKDSFFNSCAAYLNKNKEVDLSSCLAGIEMKSTVLYPGLDLAELPEKTKKQNDQPVICWNHRWEHDKNPEEFFDAIALLEEKGYDFRLVVLGQSFQHQPLVFDDAQKRFADKVIQFGYVDSRKEYLSWLAKSDIVVSTAYHEFFGIAVIEAVHAGCIPLVPDRLSYPELYPAEYRYREGELFLKLARLLKRCGSAGASVHLMNMQKFDWSALQQRYENWLLR